MAHVIYHRRRFLGTAFGKIQFCYNVVRIYPHVREGVPMSLNPDRQSPTFLRAGELGPAKDFRLRHPSCKPKTVVIVNGRIPCDRNPARSDERR